MLEVGGVVSADRIDPDPELPRKAFRRADQARDSLAAYEEPQGDAGGADALDVRDVGCERRELLPEEACAVPKDAIAQRRGERLEGRVVGVHADESLHRGARIALRKLDYRRERVVLRIGRFGERDE